jgi:hypothetical protein
MFWNLTLRSTRLDSEEWDTKVNFLSIYIYHVDKSLIGSARYNVFLRAVCLPGLADAIFAARLF